MMIAMGGDRFTERGEQEGLFEILTKAQKEYAWPTQSVYVIFIRNAQSRADQI
jgi:hypothetical protein